MIYRVGDKVICSIETRTNGYKYVTSRPPLPDYVLMEEELQIIGIHRINEDCEKIYVVLIPNDCIGFVISKFHIDHYNIPAAFLGKKFWELTEDWIRKP